jgi:hypothetical protein
MNFKNISRPFIKNQLQMNMEIPSVKNKNNTSTVIGNPLNRLVITLGIHMTCVLCCHF